MFQSFTGTSRRPRQVNLSGRNVDPFAATSWTPTTATSTQKTIIAAQRDREARQRERDQLAAAKTIQRRWRGHSSRRSTAHRRRVAWDVLDAQSTPLDLERMLLKARFLRAFFSDKESEDYIRAASFARELYSAGNEPFTAFITSRLSQNQASALTSSFIAAMAGMAARGADSHSRNSDGRPAGLAIDDLHLCIIKIAELRPSVLIITSAAYFTAVSDIIQNKTSSRTLRLIAKVLAIIREADCNGDLQPAAIDAFYREFAFDILSTPGLLLDGSSLSMLGDNLDFGRLSAVLAETEHHQGRLSSLAPERRISLLAQYINLERAMDRDETTLYISVISRMLAVCANDISNYAETTANLNAETDDDDDSTNEGIEARDKSLRRLLQMQLESLVNKRSITRLVSEFQTADVDSSMLHMRTSILTSYILVLLQVFPQRSEEMLLWLYTGSVDGTQSTVPVPVVKLLWSAMSKSPVFSSVQRGTEVLSILKGEVAGQSFVDDASTILLFLELYAFVLRFTDDDEFLNGGKMPDVEASVQVSISRASALSLGDVESLTRFLSNLAFTLFYNAVDLFNAKHVVTSNSSVDLSSYFTSSVGADTHQPSEHQDHASVAEISIGTTGMTFSMVRNSVIKVLKMIYQRDSRRQFLPSGSWLMISRFNMDGFIPAVVAEEESRQDIASDANDEDESRDVEPALDLARPTIGMNWARIHIRAERARKERREAARHHLMASIAPRLQILQNMPFAIPFETRVHIFRQFVFQDMEKRRNGHVDPDLWRISLHQAMAGHEARELGRHHAKIRRDEIFEDAFDQYYELGQGLKEPIQITFVDQFDTPEAGIDGGGVTKEFLTSITKEAFGPENGNGGIPMFRANKQNLLYPNPTAMEEQRARSQLSTQDAGYAAHSRNKLLQRYEFLGRIIGKCLYEGILVDIAFAGFFLRKWAVGNAGYLANINDLRDLDEDLYQGLLKFKNYPGNVEDFGTDFTITDEISFSREKPPLRITRNLIPDGSNIIVNNERRIQFLTLVARYRLDLQPRAQTQAFLSGLGQIIKPSWLAMFNQAELQTLIGGDSSEIDIDDLRQNTMYGGVFVIGDDGMEHPTIQLFWRVMKSLEDVDRRKVLKYVTSTPRAPLLGFAQLNPRFSIRDSSDDQQRLPSTSTCINLLKLPRYKTEGILRAKLLYAVNSGAGFDLS